jgi:hypothetical protein
MVLFHQVQEHAIQYCSSLDRSDFYIFDETSCTSMSICNVTFKLYVSLYMNGKSLTSSEVKPLYPTDLHPSLTKLQPSDNSAILTILPFSPSSHEYDIGHVKFSLRSLHYIRTFIYNTHNKRSLQCIYINSRTQ